MSYNNTFPDTRAEFDRLEMEGDFNKHLNPVDTAEMKPVDEDFPYIPKGRLKIKYALINFFVVKPFRWYHAKFTFRTKVKGKENLKGVKSAIVTSNHIAMLDCMANSYVLKKHNIKIVGAEFNNKNTAFGEYMRIGGMIPLSSKYKVMKKFNNAVEHYLLHNRYVLIYPEESMWDMYDKPRPYKNGAFFYAAKFDVPVIPMFITLRNAKKPDKNGTFKQYFTVNIAKPVYPDKNLTQAENIEFLKNAAYQSCVNIYEETYGKKLTYAKREDK